MAGAEGLPGFEPGLALGKIVEIGATRSAAGQARYIAVGAVVGFAVTAELLLNTGPGFLGPDRRQLLFAQCLALVLQLPDFRFGDLLTERHTDQAHHARQPRSKESHFHCPVPSNLWRYVSIVS